MANVGTVARVAGVVVDVGFASGDLPSINNALVIAHDAGPELVVEVQEHVDPYTVRTVVLGSTLGLRRGLPVQDTGHPIRVPVGRATLGRMFNVLGQPIERATLSAADYYDNLAVIISRPFLFSYVWRGAL